MQKRDKVETQANTTDHHAKQLNFSLILLIEHKLITTLKQH